MWIAYHSSEALLFSCWSESNLRKYNLISQNIYNVQHKLFTFTNSPESEEVYSVVGHVIAFYRFLNTCWRQGNHRRRLLVISKLLIDTDLKMVECWNLGRKVSQKKKLNIKEYMFQKMWMLFWNQWMSIFNDNYIGAGCCPLL